MGCRYGASRPRNDIPVLVDLYLAGQLKLDELVSRTYELEQFDEALADLHAGNLARGVFTLLRAASFADLYKRLSNWGRWGDDDEIGTLNLIDDAAVRRGVDSVRTGQRFTLGIPLDDKGPQMGFVKGRVNPLRTMIAINEPVERRRRHHGPAGRHALGRPRPHELRRARSTTASRPTPSTAHGASRCGIDKVPPIVTRGVLLDVARAKGVDRLEGGTAVTADDLDAARRAGRGRAGAGRRGAGAHRPDAALPRRRPARATRIPSAGLGMQRGRVDAQPRRRRGRHRQLHVRGRARARSRSRSSRCTSSTSSPWA